MIIDTFTHFVPQPYLKSLLGVMKQERLNNLTRGEVFNILQMHDLSERIERMNKYQIDIQSLMLAHTLDPNELGLNEIQTFELSKIANDNLSELMEKGRQRIVSIGSAPLLALESGGLEEMDRAVKDLGLRGFMVSSNVAGKPLDSPNFQRFWQKIEQLDVPVFVHPTDSTECRPYEKQYDLMHVFGWPFETTISLSRLVLSGILDSYPNVKIVSHHLGGMLPFYAGRIQESYAMREIAIPGETKLRKPIMEYFKEMYHDTAVGGIASTLRCGYDVFGADHMLFATDYPFGSEGGDSRLRNYPTVVKSLDISEDEKNMIFEKNARKLLRLT